MTVFILRAIILVKILYVDEGIFTVMMKRLRGRNLKHPRCLIGITLGLTLGIIIAGLLAYYLNVSYNLVLLIWLLMTVGLGAIGWIIGDRMSSRFPALEDTQPPATSDAPSSHQ